MSRGLDLTVDNQPEWGWGALPRPRAASVRQLLCQFREHRPPRIHAASTAGPGRQADDARRNCAPTAMIVRPHTLRGGRLTVNKERYGRWACRPVKILAKMQTIERL